MSLPGRILLGILLVMCCPGNVFAWDWHTRVNISVKDQPLKVVCELLEQQYGVRFSYSREIVDLSHRITLDIQQKPLKAVLDEMFSPYDIRFTRIGEQIVLSMRRTFTVSGYVQDERSGEKLIGATVWSAGQGAGTLTNQYGFFSLTLPKKDTGSLFVSYIGYNTSRLTMSSSRPVIVRLSVKNSLKEVVIYENSEGNRIREQAQMSRLSVSPADVKSMPRLLGEADVMRTIAALPGVSGGIDGGGLLNVRGGSPDQNLILLDGTPIYNASHLFGIFSVFNPDIVKTAEFYKGAFPARYGGRLSSVVDIAMKDGDMEHYHGEASIGLIAAKAMLEGPLDVGKTSFVVSARRSYLDLLGNNLLQEDDGQQKLKVSVYFYDANLKVNHIFSEKDRLYFSGYLGKDKLGLQRNEDSTDAYKENTNARYEFGNYAATLRWNHIYSPQLFSNATVNYSQYYFSTGYTYNYQPSLPNDADYLYGRYYSRIENAVAKLDFEFRPNPKHTIKFGGAAITHIFNPGVSIFEDNSSSKLLLDTTYNDAASVGEELLVYAEDEWAITDRLRVNAGLHLSGFAVGGHFYRSAQPRLGAHYLLPHQWALKLSYTHMNQYLHLLSSESTTLPNDLWLPSTDKVRPMFSRQASFGIVKTTKNNGYGFTLEGYYKTMDNVIEYKDQNDLFDNAGKAWDEKVDIGKGWSYGSELMLEKKRGKLKGWISYTLSWAERRFPGVNNGAPFPYKYDRRHNLEVVVSQRIGKRWETSANWEFTSGLPLTLPVASYEGVSDGSPYDPPGNTPILDHLGDRNQFRTRAMHRLDLSATHTKPKKWGSRSWTFSLYNAYNQQNPFFYTIVTDRAKQERYLAEISILPILPSVSYSIKF